MFGIGIIHALIKYGIGILIVAMIIRVFASWFGADERFAFIRFLARMTDPFITPIRRIVRPVGVMDMFMLRLTAVIVEPAGIVPAMSNANTPRRSSPMPFSPAKK